MRKLASIQRIVNIRPIEKADAIEVVEILGWECIVKKSEEFKVGELVVYIEVDSIVPEKPEFEFLRDRKFRIRTIKLRGQVSQGLVLPLSILPKGEYKEGSDVSDVIGVKKYDPQLEIENKLMEEYNKVSKNRIDKFFKKFSWYRRLTYRPDKSPFPKFIKKTDEDRIQLFPDICEREKETSFEMTEKLDGQSLTCFLIKNPKKWQFWNKYIFGVCSRNYHLIKEDNSSYWTIAKQYNIKNILQEIIKDNKYVVLQGEIIGNKIQKNKYKIFGYDLYAFNLIYPNKKCNNFEMINTLTNYDIKCVPLLEVDFKLKPSIKEMVEYAKGESVIYPTIREGVVIRNYEKGISFKVINPDFSLKEE
jgi:hypothetical protein